MNAHEHIRLHVFGLARCLRDTSSFPKGSIFFNSLHPAICRQPDQWSNDFYDAIWSATQWVRVYFQGEKPGCWRVDTVYSSVQSHSYVKAAFNSAFHDHAQLKSERRVKTYAQTRSKASRENRAVGAADPLGWCSPAVLWAHAGVAPLKV
jgi:hypothetical protein